MEIKSICVIGGGRMGRQIALNSAIYGFKSVVYDLKQEVCEDVNFQVRRRCEESCTPLQYALL